MLIQTIAIFFYILEGSESSLTENVDCNLHFINLLQRYGIDYLALKFKTILDFIDFLKQKRSVSEYSKIFKYYSYTDIITALKSLLC